MKHTSKVHKTPTPKIIRHYYWERAPCEDLVGPALELRNALDNKDEVSIKKLAREQPNVRVNEGGTLLHEAAAMGDGDLFRDLLEIGSDYSVHDNRGNTALDVAIRAVKHEIVQIFSDFTSGSSHEFGKVNILHQAINLRSEPIVKLLTKDGESLCAGIEKHFH
jgi:ankyrin repeat protein